ncbi:ATP-dependent DNA helicase PIF1-like [Hydra vulgaris]|uniref:ATP-dependent DNA helicase n=1 Tax=Hydra vulgaris TaxID=6087 RepID=A0ABM4DLY6_HYDVU
MIEENSKLEFEKFGRNDLYLSQVKIKMYQCSLNTKERICFENEKGFQDCENYNVFIPYVGRKIERLFATLTIRNKIMINKQIIIENSTKKKMKLSSEQKLAFKWLDDGENFFITGGAGCGKSYLIDAIAKSEQIYKQMTVTAITGIAAYLLNGSTVHSFAGIETGTKSDDYYIRYMHPEVHKRWLQTDVLIIDEISMINAETFDLLHRLGCKIRKCEDELFGGIQVIVCGDFYQLKPIVGNYAFQSSIWKQYIVKVLNLTTYFRQKDDLQFFNVLNELRLGQVSADSIEYLTKRHFIDEDSINDEYTRLFFRNLSVQFYNHKKMKDIKYKEFTFYSKDVIKNPKATALFRIPQSSHS